jgi:hypothetical protein
MPTISARSNGTTGSVLNTPCMNGTLARDGLSRGGMVARDHLHPNAGLLAFPDRRKYLLARWIDEPEQAEQGGPMLDIVKAEIALALHVLDRDGKHAPALPRHGVGLLAPEVPVERLVPEKPALPAAHGEQPPWRSFDESEAVPVLMAVMQGRHELMLSIEGNFVGSRQLLAEKGGVMTGLDSQAHQRAFHGIAVHSPCAVGHAEVGVVAQDGGSCRFDQRRVSGGLDRPSVKVRTPLRDDSRRRRHRTALPWSARCGPSFRRG